jgi:pyruvyltransferase
MNKAKKVFRYWKARLQPSSALPLSWHVGRPNFGDDINPAFFSIAVGRPARLETRRNIPHFLGMGSILDRASSASTVLGSGCLLPPAAGSLHPGRVVAVRGALSLAGLARREDVLLGDPMVLLGLIASCPVYSDGPVGLVPHVSEMGYARRMKIPGVKIIDPGHDPWRVIRDIAGCSRIFSQSLHGLIVADTLQIPNVWIAPSLKMVGDSFKFADYFSTLDASKEPYPFDLDTFRGLPAHFFDVRKYKYDKKVLLDAIRQGVALQLPEHT